MYRVFMFSASGQYVSPIDFEEFKAAIHELMKYFNIIAYAIVTNSDNDNELMFEIKNGNVIEPSIEDIQVFLSQFMIFDRDVFVNFPADKIDAAVKRMHKQVVELVDCKNGEETYKLKERIRQLDCFLQAYAAYNNINIYSLGYKNPVKLSVQLTSLESI